MISRALKVVVICNSNSKIKVYTCTCNSKWSWYEYYFIQRQIVIVMECEVMCNTGSITYPLHDCAFSIKAFIMPRAVCIEASMS